MKPEDKDRIDEAFLRKLTDVVMQNLGNDQFGVNQLAKAVGMSRFYIHRYLKDITNLSVSQFIRKIRLEEALKILRNQEKTASEVSYAVGFHSPTYFNKCFHEYFGYPPGEARKVGWVEEGIYSSEESLTSSEKNPEIFLSEPDSNWIKKRGNWVLATAGVIVCLLVAFVIMDRFKSSSSGFKSVGGIEKSILVLPFKNLSPDTSNVYFADGITEDILNHLSRISELRVLSRTSSAIFRDSRLSVPEIARQMAVNYVLEGSVRRHDDRVRISAQLIDARADRHLWSENYDRQMTDIFAIQSDIAFKVAEELKSVLTTDEKSQIIKTPTRNTEAYNYYLMGRFFWNKRTEEGLLKSVEYFEKAIAADPDYALAHAGLADANFIQAWWDWVERPHGYEKSKQLAVRALELDINLAEAYATLGAVLCYHDWNWEESRELFKKAIQLNPNYGTARQYYAGLLEILNENEEAFKQIDKAVELDPVVFMFRSMRAGMYHQAGRYDEALEEARILDEMHPKHSLLHGFQTYYKQKEYDKAVEILQEIMRSDASTIRFADEVWDIYNKAGSKGILQWLIKLEEQKSFTNPYRVARWYILMEEKELALNWLEIAFENRIATIPRINCNADFDILRSEPRFLALIEKMGLTQYQKSSAD